MSPALDDQTCGVIGRHGHTRRARVKLSMAGANLFELSEDDPAVNRSTLYRSSSVALLYKSPDSAGRPRVGNGACIRAAESGSDWF